MSICMLALVMVHQVNEILEIPEEAIQKTPDFGTNIRPEFIQRMGRVNNEFVVLLDIFQVLSIDELSGINESMVDS